MDDIPGPNDRQGPRQLNWEALDLSRVNRIFRRALWLLALVPIVVGLNWTQSFYADWLWFEGVGYDPVLVKIIVTRVVLYVAAVLLFLVLAGPLLYAAHRSTSLPPIVARGALPPRDYEFVRGLLFKGMAALVVLAALFLAAHPAGEWRTVLLFLNAVPFGETDPVFGRDISFFVFTLPALELARLWLMGAVVTTMLILAGFYYLTARLRGETATFRGRARMQLAVLGGGLFLLIAVGHWLGRYDLLLSSTGTVFGVGHTDNYVNLPGLAFLTAVAVATAGCLFVAGVFYRGHRLILWPVVGWLGLTLLVGSALPTAVQRLQVEPSELAREREFLANNIEFTREAFGLEALQSQDHPAEGTVDAQTVAENQGTLQNVRLWDESPLLQSYNQIQFFRLYYDFLAVHTDRYRVGDELRQVMLATRELSAEKLPTEAQRWVNRHLQFTHGYGVAMSPVTEVEAGGRPSFLVSDVPPVGPIPLERPEIYYGLKSLDYVIARTSMQEFNYPGPEGPEYTRYDGTGGVEMTSLFRQFLYAWEFSDLNILISGEIEPDSRLQYRRTVPERVSAITPFLVRDSEAYSVVADGRLFWIQDAYTVTDRYPYSTRWNGRFNYIRNSVKAVVDAYNGTVDYYVFDPDDPLIQAYMRMFPGLFKSREEMPEYLRAHIRYPEDLFAVQTQMLLQYHMQDPVVFYNKEDQWSVPGQTSFGRSQLLRPYYIVARLPGEEREEFLLIQPFTPANRHNLVGWMAARSDGENYGELVLYQFPTGRHVDGPSQVEARIDNDAVISEQFTLWGQVGSEVLRGILLVIPLGDALLYAEPVFLIPETLAFPELRRIILADANQVVMHQTLDASVRALVGELPAVAPAVDDEVAPTPGVQPDAEDAGPAPADPGIDPEAVDALRRAVEDAIEALRDALDALEAVPPETSGP